MESIETERTGLREKRGWVHTHSTALVDLFRLVDFAWIFAGIWLASVRADIDWGSNQLYMAAAAIGIFTLLVTFMPLYRSWRLVRLRVEMLHVSLLWLATAAVISLLGNLPLFSSFLPGLIILWMLITWAGLIFTRAVLRIGLRILRQHGANYRTAAIAGANPIGIRVANEIQSTSWMGLRLIGFFDDRKEAEARRDSSTDVTGNLNDLVEHAKTGMLDIIYITLPLRAELRIKELIKSLHDTTTTVYYIPDFSSFSLLHARMSSMHGIPMVSLIDTPHQGVSAYSKRIFDFIGSCLILTAVSLPMIAISAAIKLTSKGPVIFRQTRYGLGGRNFEILKFRTMYANDDNTPGYIQATRNDSRTTSLGKFLRRTSLDELPQLFNVLFGKMSLVGPRPHPIALNESQRKLIDRYMLRHKVKPGITGWAQVNGFRGETETLEKMKKRIEYDLQYINNWSIILDLKIIFMTVGKLIYDKNAY